MSWSGCLGVFLGPGQRDVQVGQDGSLDAGELVEDGAGGGVGEVQAVEGGEGGAGGGDGGALLGRMPGRETPGPRAARSSASISPKISSAMPMMAMRASIRSSLCRNTGRTRMVCFRSRWRCSTTHWSL